MRRLARCCFTILGVVAALPFLAAHDARAQGGGETCATATLLPCDVDVNQATNTVGHVNNYDLAPGTGGGGAPGSCTGYNSSGPDIVYRIDLNVGASCSFQFVGGYDASVYLVTDCSNPAATCVSGSDTYPPPLPDAVAYSNPTAAVQTVYLIIDGFGPDATTANMGAGVLTGTITCGGTVVTAACCNRSTGGCSEITDLACAAADGIFYPGLSCLDLPCGPAESRCVLPGLSVTHDDTGDFDPTLGNSQYDVQRVQIAEPYAGGSNQLVLTMKVANLAADVPSGLPVNSLWTVFWDNTGTGEQFPRHFVQMTTCDPTALPGFAYGHAEPNPPAGDLNVTDGATTGSYTTDGTITMFIDPALVGSPPLGPSMTNVSGQTFLFAPGAACTGFINVIDESPTGTYTVAGNNFCKPFTVACNVDIAGDANQGNIPLSFSVTNPSTASRRFAVTLTETSAWLVGGNVSTSMTLAAGASQSITPSLRFNNQCTPVNPDVLTFQAVASDLPLADERRTCTTTASCRTVGVGDQTRSLSFGLMGSNPVRGEGLLNYSLPERSPVKIEVFGVGGQRLRTLVNRVDGPGSYSVPFLVSGGHGLGAGVYLVRITAGHEQRSLRVVALD